MDRQGKGTERTLGWLLGWGTPATPGRQCLLVARCQAGAGRWADQSSPSSQAGGWMLTQHFQLQTSRPNHANLAKPSGMDSASFEDDTIRSEEAWGVSYVGGKVGKTPGSLVEEGERI